MVRPPAGRAADLLAALRGVTAREVLLVAAMFLVGAGTRLATRSHVPYHWDSVNFALALEHYDIAAHQPHPPGYILYVLMGRALYALLGDANDSLVAISIMASGLLIVTAYLLGRDLFDRPTGIHAALLALSGPLVWFHGSVALSYIVELLLTGLIAWCCYQSLLGRRHSLVAASVLLAVAGGVRQNTLPLMMPLWLFCVARAESRDRPGALLGLILPTLLWAAAMLHLAGGTAAYLRAVVGQTGDSAVLTGLGSMARIVTNLTRLTVYALYAMTLGVTLLPLVLLPAVKNPRRYLVQPRWKVLSLWLLPSLAFYALFVQQAGYTFTYMMALIIIAAYGSRHAVGRGFRRVLGTDPSRIALALVLLCNVAFFLAAPPFLFGLRKQLLSAPSWRAIRERDGSVQERVAYVRQHFPPHATVIVASSFDFRLPDYYLRDYARLSAVAPPEDGTTVVVLASDTDYVVLFDEGLTPAPAGERPQEAPLPSGATLRWFRRGVAQELVLTGTSVSLRSLPGPGAVVPREPEPCSSLLDVATRWSVLPVWGGAPRCVEPGGLPAPLALKAGVVGGCP